METDFELIETEIVLEKTVFKPKERDSAMKKYRRRRTLMQNGRRAEFGNLELSLREIEGVGWGRDNEMNISLGDVERNISKKEELFCDPESWNKMKGKQQVEPRSSQAHSTSQSCQGRPQKRSMSASPRRRFLTVYSRLPTPRSQSTFHKS